jgi:hypothetical protein
LVVMVVIISEVGFSLGGDQVLMIWLSVAVPSLLSLMRFILATAASSPAWGLEKIAKPRSLPSEPWSSAKLPERMSSGLLSRFGWVPVTSWVEPSAAV